MNETMNICISPPQGFSEIGQKSNQEDSLYPLLGQADARQRVFLLCDGMGGHAHGEVVSRCVADAVGTWVEQQLSAKAKEDDASASLCTMQQMEQFFTEGLSRAYAELDQLDNESAADGSSRSTMGTTLTFLAICADGMLVAHIGDSRIYQLRLGSGVVFQTCDHSLVNELLLAGEITEEEARTHPRRNVITRAVQPHQEEPSRPTFDRLTDIRRGDVFLLCCDGVTEQLSNADLEHLLLTTDSLAERIDALRSLCAERHTRDNHTCWAFEVEQVEKSEQEEQSAVETPSSQVAQGKEKPQTQVQDNPCQPTTTHYYWVWFLLVLLALAGFVAGYFYTQGTSSHKAEIAPSVSTQVDTMDSVSDSGIQGTLKRAKRR